MSMVGGAVVVLALAAPPPSPTPSASPSSDYLGRARQMLDGLDRDRLMAQIRETYEQAKASGERVPADLWTWVREDLARAGTWEYRVLRTRGQDATALETELNTLGRERWECVGLTSPSVDRHVMVFKRPSRSYLGHLNLRDVMRVMPDRN
jgi:hypothetical protein